MTLLLLPFFPIAPIMSGLGFVFLYYIERYKVVNKYRKPEQINGEISIFFLSIMRIGTICYSIMTYSVQTEADREKAYSIALLVLGIIFACFPFELFKDKVIAFDDVAASYNFDEKYFSFGTNYEIVNPITKSLGENKYLNKLIEKKIITQEDKEKFLNGEMGEISNVIELYYNKIGKKKAAKKFLKKNKTKGQGLLGIGGTDILLGGGQAKKTKKFGAGLFKNINKNKEEKKEESNQEASQSQETQAQN